MAIRMLATLLSLELALVAVEAAPPSIKPTNTYFTTPSSTKYETPTKTADCTASSSNNYYTSPSSTGYESPTETGEYTTSTPDTLTTEYGYTSESTGTPTDKPWSESYSYTETEVPTAAPTNSGVRFQPDGASPGFFCEYPTFTGWEACNGPDSRDCWLRKTSQTSDADEAYAHNVDQLDINTDYENPDTVPTGVTREYWLEVDGDITLTADGFQKTSGKTFNGTFPGPLIEACWGDKVIVHVKNNYDKNGTTVHWHGIRQLGTNQMDGVNGVTQCPISKGDAFTYEWRALQYGNTWYHSHYAVQYSDGVVAPLVIYGPWSDNWDINLGSVMVQDYVHETAFIAFQREKTANDFARADSIVVNGQGHDPATGTGSYFDVKLTPGKKHLIRLINSSAGTTFVVSIDGHTMKVIANDLVAIEPFETTSLRIGIGQRYTIIVEANQDPGAYWIRTHPATGCNGFSPSLGSCNATGNATVAGVFTDDCVLFDVRTAIARYADDGGGGDDDDDNTTLPTSQAQDYDLTCVDEPYENLRPVVPWTIDERPANNITRDRFTVARQNPGLGEAVYEPGGYQHWEFTPEFFWIDFEAPLILNTSWQGAWDPNYHVIEEPYEAGYIFMIFEANINSPTPNDSSVIPLAHPIHWHGHDVVILAQSSEQFDPDTSFDDFNFENPPRRDVVLLPGNGYIAVAIRADNPGVWLIHCHIAWHSSAGLAMQNLEAQSKIVESIGGQSALTETERVCANWKEYNAKNPVLQDESGV